MQNEIRPKHSIQKNKVQVQHDDVDNIFFAFCMFLNTMYTPTQYGIWTALIWDHQATFVCLLHGSVYFFAFTMFQ